MHSSPAETSLHGVLAEFRTPEELLAAIESAKAAGYTKLDAYTPYPIEKVLDALDLHHSKVPLLTLGAAIFGAVAVFSFAYWASAIDYPLNIGGRPLNSWVAFSIPTYETTILLAALATAGGMLAINGLPQPYHPVFNVEAFRKTASSTGFFLCIEATDPRFDLGRTRAFLEGLHPKGINEVNA